MIESCYAFEVCSNNSQSNKKRFLISLLFLSPGCVSVIMYIYSRMAKENTILRSCDAILGNSDTSPNSGIGGLRSVISKGFEDTKRVIQSRMTTTKRKVINHHHHQELEATLHISSIFFHLIRNGSSITSARGTPSSIRHTVRSFRLWLNARLVCVILFGIFSYLDQ